MDTNLIDRIRKNQTGGTKSYLTALSEELPEVTESSYWLIAGVPGTGKTALMDKLFVLDPAIEGQSVYWVYRSMERKVIYKKAKWLAYIIWKKEGRLFDIHTILQRKKKKKSWTDEDMKMIRHYYDWMEKNIFAHMEIIPDRSTTANIKAVYKRAYEKASGKYDLVIHLVDHLDKITGKGEKYTVISEYTDTIGELRDSTNGIFCDVVQVRTRSVSNTTRLQHQGPDTNLGDLYQGEKVAQNADVTLAITHPARLSIPMYKGYSVSSFTPPETSYSTLRGVSVIKANFDKEVTISCNFIGQVGDFEQLPHYNLIEDYTYYTMPEHRNLIHNLENG